MCFFSNCNNCELELSFHLEYVPICVFALFFNERNPCFFELLIYYICIWINWSIQSKDIGSCFCVGFTSCV